MTNPIKALEDYVGVRPKGRHLTLKEQFQEYSVKTLNSHPIELAIKKTAYWTVFFAVISLSDGTDLLFSQMLMTFGGLFVCFCVAFYAIQAAGRKNKAAGTY